MPETDEEKQLREEREFAELDRIRNAEVNGEPEGQNIGNTQVAPTMTEGEQLNNAVNDHLIQVSFWTWRF